MIAYKKKKKQGERKNNTERKNMNPKKDYPRD